jgi:hypothetical protein
LISNGQIQAGEAVPSLPIKPAMMRHFAIAGCLLLSGCSMFPEIGHQPTLHNPFPQITKVAVAPFFNLSHEPTLDGRKVAAAYFSELQLVPGFEVVPVGVVERKMQDLQISLRGPAEAQRLAQILDVDAIVVGAVTDYSPYYPPRLALQVEWYAANPCFHPIPPGYGLPLGTSAQKEIPEPLVFEAQMAAAKAQLGAQTPQYQKATADLPPQGDPLPPAGRQTPQDGQAAAIFRSPPVAGMPAVWPEKGKDAAGNGNCPKPACNPNDAPVMQRTRTYNGNDAQFIEALKTYYNFADDARLGGWQGYLQRSDDFIGFCCHMNVWEMLSARGGAGPSRVVWRWPRKSE